MLGYKMQSVILRPILNGMSGKPCTGVIGCEQPSLQLIEILSQAI